MDSESVFIFSLALVIIVILWFFTKQKLQNISETHAATWWQKPTADLS